MSRRSSASQQKKKNGSGKVVAPSAPAIVRNTKQASRSDNSRLAASLLDSLVMATSAESIFADYEPQLRPLGSCREAARVTAVALDAFESDSISAIDAAEEIISQAEASMAEEAMLCEDAGLAAEEDQSGDTEVTADQSAVCEMTHETQIAEKSSVGDVQPLKSHPEQNAAKDETRDASSPLPAVVEDLASQENAPDDVSEEATPELQSTVSPVVEIEIPAQERAEQISADDSSQAAAPSGSSEGTTASAGCFQNDLQQFAVTIREEFRSSIAELQAAQTAAITAQSEVLRALTEMVYQSAASKDIPVETLERAFSGVEERLLARIESVAGGGRSSTSSGIATPAASGRTGLTSGPVKLQNAASSVNRSWEQIRNEMMSRGELTETPSLESERSPSAGSAMQLHDVAQLSSDRHFKLPEQDPSLEIPATVDPDTLSDQELRTAFRERESFISTLIARIRRQQDSATGQLSLEQLRSLAEDLPDDLAVQVRHTLKQMDDLARLGELELSLERARIARQINQLEHSRQTIERNARQLGLHLNPDGTIEPPANQPGRHSSSRRWLGKLGFGQQSSG